MQLRRIPDRDITPKTILYANFQNVPNNAEELWIKQLLGFLNDYNITLNSAKTARLSLRRLRDKLLTKVFTGIVFKVTNLIQLKGCILVKRALSIADIDIEDGRGISKNSNYFKAKPKEIHYYWSKGKLGSSGRKYG